MKNEIDIQDVFDHAKKLLVHNNVENLLETTFQKYISGYSDTDKIPMNQEKIQEKLKLIYWAVVSIYIEIGNMLIAIRSYNKFKELGAKYVSLSINKKGLGSIVDKIGFNETFTIYRKMI